MSDDGLGSVEVVDEGGVCKLVVTTPRFEFSIPDMTDEFYYISPITYRLGIRAASMAERCVGVSVTFAPLPWVIVELWAWDVWFGWIPMRGGQ